jgi:hypothetical protein
MSTDRDERIAVWNGFFKLAWMATKTVFESGGSQTDDQFTTDPPPLQDDQVSRLAAVLMCNLAIEARANHLIHDLAAKHKISNATRDAARHLPARLSGS